MSQEPEQERAGQGSVGQTGSKGAGSENAAATEHPAAPVRPKYTPPSYVPPVDRDKDANATEPIPSYPTRPLPRDLPPGAPPLPGTAEQGRGATDPQGTPGQAQSQNQNPVGQSGQPHASSGQPGQPQPQPGQPQPQGYPGQQPLQGQPQPGQQHPNQPGHQPAPGQSQPPGYPGQQAHPGYPGQQPHTQQYPGAAQQYPGQPYPPQGYPPQPYAQGYPGYPPAQAYGQPLYYAPVVEPKGLSIAAMICGIAVYAGFGFFILPQIAAVVLGHMGLAREPAGRGFAIAGLVMGYIGIALTLVVLAFFVVFASSINSYDY